MDAPLIRTLFPVQNVSVCVYSEVTRHKCHAYPVVVELAGISRDTTLMEGETALLTCVGFGQHDIAITWMRNGAAVTNSSLISSYQQDLLVEGITFQQSTLQLCGALMSDSGAYTCVISNGLTTINSAVWLNVTAAGG